MATDDFPSVTDTEGASCDHGVTKPPSIEGYEIQAKLGEGGMGVVWSAVQTTSKRRVALKQMKPHTLFSRSARARFQREMEVAANLEHPHIARVYDCNLERTPYFFTMELIQGQRIDQYVLSQNLEPRKIAELFIPVCHAVSHAHQNGVIHRDLKPSNILVSEEGSPYIVDFGVAKQMDEETVELTVSSLGTGPGTLNYMSPEQVMGGKVDTRSDIYALGIILYQLLSNRFPYHLTGSEYERMQHIANDEPTPLRIAVPGISSDLEAIVLAALVKEPVNRYQSAGELAYDLENWLSDRPISIKASQSLYVICKLIRKHRYATVVVGLLAVILVSFSWVSFYAYRGARKAEDDSHNVASQWQAAYERQLRLSKHVTFLMFLELYHQGDLQAAEGILGPFLPKGTKERLAAESLLDPSDPETKSVILLEKLADDMAWFVYCVTGEGYLRHGQNQEARQAFQQSLDSLPGDSRYTTYRFDNWLVEHVQARLYQLSDVPETTRSTPPHTP